MRQKFALLLNRGLGAQKRRKRRRRRPEPLPRGEGVCGRPPPRTAPALVVVSLGRLPREGVAGSGQLGVGVPLPCTWSPWRGSSHSRGNADNLASPAYIWGLTKAPDSAQAGKPVPGYVQPGALGPGWGPQAFSSQMTGWVQVNAGFWVPGILGMEGWAQPRPPGPRSSEVLTLGLVI